jgi:predicted ribosomally synthesized peptide with nif11-like leader
MSTKEADRFIERTASDQEFLASIEALGNDADAVFALVQSEGFDCTPEEIKEAFLEAYASQLTAEQLEAVAGGLSTSEGLGIGLGGGLGAVAVGVGVASAAIAAGAV